MAILNKILCLKLGICLITFNGWVAKCQIAKRRLAICRHRICCQQNADSRNVDKKIVQIVDSSRHIVIYVDLLVQVPLGGQVVVVWEILPERIPLGTNSMKSNKVCYSLYCTLLNIIDNR